MDCITLSDLISKVPDFIEEGERRLIQSLSSIKDRASSKDLETLTSSLLELTCDRHGAISPWSFLGYYRLGTTLVINQKNYHQESIDIITNICHLIKQDTSSTKLIAFGDNNIATNEVWSYFLKVLQDGGSFPEDLTHPDNKTFESIKATITDALQIIEKIDPELKVLMNHLQGLIIAGQPGLLASQKNQSFGGATCFFFRGGTIINTYKKISKARMIERLIHEYAHAELFTIAQKELICLNTDDELYPVLIRSDPRPMNGIIHSLYVVCRVADFQVKSIRKGNHSQNNKEFFEETKHIITEQVSYGHSSLKAIRSHAHLTPLGNMVTNACENFLADTKALTM